jgi:hypothetical protein
VRVVLALVAGVIDERIDVATPNREAGDDADQALDCR